MIGRTDATPGVRLRAWLAFGVVCCAASAMFAFFRGQDVNFDQLNYHYYTAYAFVHNRIDTDAAPAQIIHSYLNPLGYVPFYLLLRLAGPVAAAVVLGAAHGLVFVLATAIVVAVADGGPRWQRLLCIAGAAAISLASPMTLSETGTSFIDTLTGLPILAALLLMLRSAPPRPALLLICGVLVGCATALKLTNATFALGMLAACLVYGPALRDRLRGATAMLCGLALGFILLGGFWCAILWRRFGNPIFPYYNSLFRSPDFPPTSDIDRRYLPTGLLDAMAYPFRWAVGVAPKPEIGFLDIRFAVVIVLLVLGALAFWLRRRGAIPRPAGGERATTLPLVVFCCVSFALWLSVFAIQRYLVTLELLCGPLALVAIGWLVWGWWRVAAIWGVAIAALVTMVVPNWHHVPFLPGQYGLEVPPPLRGDGLFFMAGEPVSYVIPALSPQARAFGIMEWENTAADADTTITRRIAAAVRDAGARPIRVVAIAPMSLSTRVRLGSYGLQPTGTCSRIAGYSDTGRMIACDLVRSAPGVAALALTPGETLDLGDDSVGFLAHAVGTDWHGPIATSNGSPSLILRRAGAFGDDDMRLVVRYASDTPGLAITVNGAPAKALGEQRDGVWIEAAFCVVAGAVGADTVMRIDLLGPAAAQGMLLTAISGANGCR